MKTSLLKINFDGIPEAVQKALETRTELELESLTGVPQPVINRLSRAEVIYPNVRTLKSLWPYIGEFLLKTPNP